MSTQPSNVFTPPDGSWMPGNDETEKAHKTSLLGTLGLLIMDRVPLAKVVAEPATATTKELEAITAQITLAQINNLLTGAMTAAARQLQEGRVILTEQELSDLIESAVQAERDKHA